MYVCVYKDSNTKETPLPIFVQIAAPAAAAAPIAVPTLPLPLIFISAVVQVILPAYFQSFSKGADELPCVSVSTVLLQRTAALCFRSYKKSLLSWVSNRELR